MSGCRRSPTTWPSTRKTTRSAQAAAAEACVTMTLVCPMAWPKCPSKERTSAPARVSRSPVGSSARRLVGSSARRRTGSPGAPPTHGRKRGDALLLASGEFRRPVGEPVREVECGDDLVQPPNRSRHVRKKWPGSWRKGGRAEQLPDRCGAVHHGRHGQDPNHVGIAAGLGVRLDGSDTGSAATEEGPGLANGRYRRVPAPRHHGHQADTHRKPRFGRYNCRPSHGSRPYMSSAPQEQRARQHEAPSVRPQFARAHALDLRHGRPPPDTGPEAREQCSDSVPAHGVPQRFPCSVRMGADPLPMRCHGRPGEVLDGGEKLSLKGASHRLHDTRRARAAAGSRAGVMIFFTSPQRPHDPGHRAPPGPARPTDSHWTAPAA